MASLPIEAGGRFGQQKRGRHADLAALVGVSLGIVVSVFGILDYQRQLFVGMVRTEIHAQVTPLTVAMNEMDKRIGGRFDDTYRRIDDTNRRIDDANRRMDETNLRLDGLSKAVVEVGVRVGRLEGRASR